MESDTGISLPPMVSHKTIIFTYATLKKTKFINDLILQTIFLSSSNETKHELW